MSAIANTAKSYDMKGIREDLADTIYNISPEETVFVTGAGRGKKPGNTFWEWQVDALAAPDGTNAQLEGDDITTYDAPHITTRIGNYQQISRKTAIVSDTNEELDRAGRKSEMAYQLSLKGAEAKRDIETICLQNQAAVAGAAATARKTASLLAFIVTNTDIGTGAAANPPALTSGAPLTARVDGTTRPFTETILKNVAQKGWSAGAKFTSVLLGGLQKQVASGFAGVATKFKDVSSDKMATIVGAADVYVSDFGNLSLVPTRFQRNRDALFMDWNMVQLRYLRPFRTKPLAKTGDAEKRLLIAEWGLQVDNEAGLGGAFDLA